MQPRGWTLAAVAAVALGGALSAAEGPTRQDAEAGLRKAVALFRSTSPQGGYVWRYKGDLSLREGEGRGSPTVAWVQPPGTPTVGEAFLEAYEATRDPYYLEGVRQAAHALASGQLRSGGWQYHIEFEPEKRVAFAYRDVPEKRKQEKRTLLDDDTTQASLRFLARADRALEFKDAKVHEAARYALEALLEAQHPNGGWSVSWDWLPGKRPGADQYPVKQAAFPESWSRTWTKDFTGCYVLNDHVLTTVVDTLLVAGDVYNDPRCLEAAKKAGEFLVRSQLPDPQPAWAQQYDLEMHPVWSRKFEPPAVTGLESQTAIETLMLLYRRTGDRKFLAPIPKALAYLKASRLPDGKLARFYELKTNRPLYFNRAYQLTYEANDLPTHYGFIVDSRLDRIAAEYERLQAATPASLKAEREKPPALPDLEKQVRAILAAQDPRGAWVVRGRLKIDPDGDRSVGVIESSTFAENVRVLCRFIKLSRQ